MIRRKRFTKLPIQANYYPMPSAAFIEDGKLRLSILSAQPVGMASLKEGQLEVIDCLHIILFCFKYNGLPRGD